MIIIIKHTNLIKINSSTYRHNKESVSEGIVKLMMRQSERSTDQSHGT